LGKGGFKSSAMERKKAKRRGEGKNAQQGEKKKMERRILCIVGDYVSVESEWLLEQENRKEAFGKEKTGII